MKKFNGYESTKSLNGGSTQLPAGGYVLEIKNTKADENALKIMFDVAEGDHAGFFMERYNSDTGEDKKWKGLHTLWIPKDDGSEKDEWTKRQFKTFIEAVEDSNTGYKWEWDEASLIGKKVGAVFGEVFNKIDGKEIKYTALRFPKTVDVIRAGKYSVPDPWLRNGAVGKVSSSDSANNDFVSVPASMDTEIPF